MEPTWPCSISRKANRSISTHWAMAAGLLLLSGAVVGQSLPVPAAPPAPLPTASVPLPASPTGSPWTLVRTIALPGAGAASLDRRGMLYVADARHNLHQYSPAGEPLNNYAPPISGRLSQLEAWNQSKILAFYDDRQELLLLDRFLAPITQLRLADYIEGLVRLATLAPNDQLWLLNESDLTLCQFDPAVQRLTARTPLDLLVGRNRPDFRFLRQYQNNLYLVDFNRGIYVFDNLGNYRKLLPFGGLNWVGFRGDELYYVRDGQLHFFHLYQLTERTLPLPANAPTLRQVIVGEQHTYLLSADQVAVYQMAP